MLEIFNKGKNVERLIEVAAQRKIISAEQTEKISNLATELNLSKGSLNLVSALGKIGAFTILLGVILIISSNWDNISDAIKIAAFIFILAGSHLSALWLKENKPEFIKTSAALHFLGALLVIAGVGLIAQIYNLSSDTGSAFLIWFILVVPLAVILRSGPISLISAAAFFIWLNIFLASDSNYFFIPYKDFTGIIFVNFALVFILLLGLLKYRDKFAEDIFEYFEKPIIMAIGGFLYFYGFSHYFSGSNHNYYGEANDERALFVPTVLLVAAFSAYLIFFVKTKINVLLRNMLSILLVTVVAGYLIYLVDAGYLDKGFRIQPREDYYVVSFFLAVVFWIIWFLLGFWATIYGSLNSNKNLLNAGVYSIGIGVMTRFFDLVGSMAGTGFMFIVSGIFLLTLGYFLEKWRRNLLSKMQKKERRRA